MSIPDWIFGEKERLRLDYDGRLQLATGEEPDRWHTWKDLGRIERAEVPEDLEGERAELLDEWNDAIPVNELHREWAGVYRSQQGF